MKHPRFLGHVAYKALCSYLGGADFLEMNQKFLALEHKAAKKKANCPKASRFMALITPNASMSGGPHKLNQQ